MIRLLSIYLILFMISMLLWHLVIPDSLWQWLNLFLATSTGWFIHLLNPDVLVSGTVLRQSPGGFALEVTSECNASDFILLLSLAIVVWPEPSWIYKLAGVMLGIAAIQFLNIIRLITLLYLGQVFPEQFTWIHQNFWPFFFSVDTILLFLSWLGFLSWREPRGS